MKPYFEDLAWYDYLLCFVYNGIFSYVLYKIGEVFLQLNHRSLLLLVAAFQVYFFVTMADSFFHFLPLQPESSWYAFMVSSGQYPEDAKVNLLVLYYLSLFFSIVCLNTPIIYIYLCVMLYLIGVMLVMRAWKRYDAGFDARQERIASWLVLFWPAPLLFMTAPLQVAFVILGFGIFFSGWVQYLQHKKLSSLLIGSAVMVALQFESIYWVIPVALGTLLYKQAFALWIKLAATAVIVIAMVFLWGEFLLDSPLTPTAFADMRNTSIAEADVYGYGNVYWQSYGEMARDYPFIILQFLLAPLPIFMQFDLGSSPIATLDGIFMILLLMASILAIVKNWSGYKAVVMLLLFFIFFLGGAADHWMHAIRDRMPLVLLMIMCAAGLLSKSIFSARKQTADVHT